MGFFDKLTHAHQKPPPPYSAAKPSKDDQNLPSTSNTNTNPYPPIPASPERNNTQPNGPNPQSDDRPLPPGWIRQWHEGYQRYFYVDTKASGGPKSHWIHPTELDQTQNRQNPGFNPPSGPPPSQQQQQQPQYNYPAQNPTQMGYTNPVNNYQADPRQNILGNQQRRGRGGFNPLLAGAGGLAGGMLLGSMFSGHHGYDNGYEQGYENGYDNGYDNGNDFGGNDFGVNDFGGGDFGGGDFGGGDFGGGDFGGF